MFEIFEKFQNLIKSKPYFTKRFFCHDNFSITTKKYKHLLCFVFDAFLFDNSIKKIISLIEYQIF